MLEYHLLVISNVAPLFDADTTVIGGGNIEIG